jgi:hypothetical protein
MRTLKALLCLSAIAGGLATSVAQNVYSLNIVGYVNVPIQGGNKLTLVSNPLKPSNGNYNITNTIALPDPGSEGASLFKWAGTAYDNNVPSWVDGLGWFPDATIPLGEAFFIQAPLAGNITFVGEVSTGTNTTSVPNGISFLANKVPIAEPFPGGTVGTEGDSIFTWGGSAWNNLVWQYVGGLGWFGDGSPTESTNGPVVAVGGGIVLQHSGGAQTITRIFNP